MAVAFAKRSVWANRPRIQAPRRGVFPVCQVHGPGDPIRSVDPHGPRLVRRPRQPSLLPSGHPAQRHPAWYSTTGVPAACPSPLPRPKRPPPPASGPPCTTIHPPVGTSRFCTLAESSRAIQRLDDRRAAIGLGAPTLPSAQRRIPRGICERSQESTKSPPPPSRSWRSRIAKQESQQRDEAESVV